MTVFHHTGSVVVFLIWIWVLGCAAPDSRRRYAEHQRIESAVSHLDVLYMAYLQGDVQAARSNLLAAIKYMDDTPVGNLRDALPISYQRLSVLERKCGNLKEADTYLQRAKDASSEILRRMGKPETYIAEVMTELTSAEVEKEVLRWDGHYTNGNGPRYLRMIETPR